jgi:phage tail-like protein
MPDGANPPADPFQNFRFRLEIDGIQQHGFREVTIPDSTQDIIEYREGTDAPPVTVRKLPGLAKYGNVVLKWGITTASKELSDWRNHVEKGEMDQARKAVAIVLIDFKGDDVCRWELTRAWPSKYDPPDLNAAGNEVAIETLEIATEGIKRTV